jgi:hypothetical protein
LQRAHERGYLDASLRDHRAVVKAFGLWCWRLKVPMVWFERSSPHSRFAILRLEMLTTPNMLTVAGKTALKAMAEGRISAHDAVWDRVPLAQADKMAHAAFRAAIQVGNYRLNRARAANAGASDKTGKRSLMIVARRTVA